MSGHVHVFVTEGKSKNGKGYLRYRAKKDDTEYETSGGQPFSHDEEYGKEEALSLAMVSVFVCLPADSYSIEIRRDE
jgi:hypothetical protein